MSNQSEGLKTLLQQLIIERLSGSEPVGELMSILGLPEDTPYRTRKALANLVKTYIPPGDPHQTVEILTLDYQPPKSLDALTKDLINLIAYTEQVQPLGPVDLSATIRLVDTVKEKIQRLQGKAGGETASYKKSRKMRSTVERLRPFWDALPERIRKGSDNNAAEKSHKRITNDPTWEGEIPSINTIRLKYIPLLKQTEK